MLWHEQTWPAIQALDKSISVVIPLGACEQHGHHLPLLTDTIQVAAVAEGVERELKDRVLLTPPLWAGSSEHHRDFPGTISLKPSLYAQVIRAFARSVLAAGFTRVLFLNGHGGNETPAAQALNELVAEDDHAASCYLAMASWWQIGRDAIAPERHGMVTPFISHADEYETSLMLALRPDLVNREAIRETHPVLNSPFYNFEYGGKVSVFRRYHRLTATGNMGKPSAATREKGASLLAGVTADVVAFLRDFATWPALPVVGSGNR